MQITVALSVDVPERGDINALEPLVVAASRRAMGEAIQVCVHAYEEQVTRCPHCGSGDMRNTGSDQCVLLTSFGRVVLTTRRMRCQRCKHRFRPADKYLACLDETNVTAALVEAGALVGMACSDDKAVKVLAALCGVRMSAQQLRRLTQPGLVRLVDPWFSLHSPASRQEVV